MAERKKQTTKKEDEKNKTSKKVVKTSKTKNSTKKEAVSSKKDTAKVVSKKKTTAQKPKKNEKDEALKALDEELLKENANIKNEYKKKALNKIDEIEKENDKSKLEEQRSLLDELTKEPKKEDIIEDTGIFSSKVVWYLFFILLLVVASFIYVYNEDNQKQKLSQEKSEGIISADNQVEEKNANKLPTFTEKDARYTVESYFGIKTNIDSDPTKWMVDCELTSSSSAASFSKSRDGKYYVSDVIYDDLRRHFEHIITRDCFELVFGASYKNINNLTNSRVEVLPKVKYEITSVEKVEASRPTLKVTYLAIPEEGEQTSKTNIFEFKAVKGKWIINSIK